MRTHPVLTALAERGVRLGLDKIKTLLDLLGEPQFSAPVVHIAGTNGKGSTSAMVTSALVKAGYRVGTNLSPHTDQLNERFLINGLPVDDASLNGAIEMIDRARHDWAEAARMTEVPLTYFEFVTATAFLLFAQRSVDVMVVEVGLGGRLDATNVVQPVVSAVTSIGLDHCDKLGDTLALIAAEKAGIFKRGIPVVLGPIPKDAMAVLVQHANVRGCDVWRPPKLQRERRRDGTWNFGTPQGSLHGVTLGLDGAHQGGNAVVALGILHRLRQAGFRISDDQIREGFASAYIPARLERVKPALLVDGAHNLEGAVALSKHLAHLDKKDGRPETRVLLLGMGNDRDPVRFIEPLLPLVDEVVTVACSHPKARPALELALAMGELEAVIAAGGSVDDTLPEVYQEAHETVVTGSLYVAGAALAIARSGALDGLETGQGLPDDLDEIEPHD